MGDFSVENEPIRACVRAYISSPLLVRLSLLSAVSIPRVSLRPDFLVFGAGNERRDWRWIRAEHLASGLSS